MTLLASRMQCGDRALQDLTRLLDDDARASPHTREQGDSVAPLCVHHQALYFGLRRSHACAKDSCNAIGLRRRDGIVLCKKQLEEGSGRQ